MTKLDPLTPEILSPSGQPLSSVGPSALTATLATHEPKSRIWWVFKKWAWRNTAAAIWLLFLYSSLRGLGEALGTPWRSLSEVLPVGINNRTLTIVIAAWLLLICELQITQLIAFSVYVATLPIWLPLLSVFHYFRNRFGTPNIKTSPIKLRVFRIVIALIFLGIYLWWPLPSSRTALILGILALTPGFFLLRRTFRFCVAPGKGVHDFRFGIHGLYESLKEKQAEATLAQNTTEDSAKWAEVQQWLISKYESSFLGEIERGLLRKLVVLYFCALLAASLLYIGFTAALFLRAFTSSPEALAAALGRQELPNLIHMAAICSLGLLGETRFHDTILSPAGGAVVLLLKIIGSGTSIVFTATFFSGYSMDIGRAEAKPEEKPMVKSEEKPEEKP